MQALCMPLLSCSCTKRLCVLRIATNTRDKQWREESSFLKDLDLRNKLRSCVSHEQRMEPQLYKLLEASWEAWTDSGIDVRSLRDSNRCGVYTGICGSEVQSIICEGISVLYVNRCLFFFRHAQPECTIFVVPCHKLTCISKMMARP